MGRSILHRKVMQNRRRELDPTADHMMAATHYKSDAFDDFVEQRDNPHVPEEIVQIKKSEMHRLLRRISVLEAAQSPAQLATSSDVSQTHSESGRVVSPASTD
jgi:hypothetical protein